MLAQDPYLPTQIPRSAVPRFHMGARLVPTKAQATHNASLISVGAVGYLMIDKGSPWRVYQCLIKLRRFNSLKSIQDSLLYGTIWR